MTKPALHYKKLFCFTHNMHIKYHESNRNTHTDENFSLKFIRKAWILLKIILILSVSCLLKIEKSIGLRDSQTCVNYVWIYTPTFIPRRKNILQLSQFLNDCLLLLGLIYRFMLGHGIMTHITLILIRVKFVAHYI